MAVSDANVCAHVSFGRVERDPVDARRCELGTQKLFGLAYDDAVPFRLDAHDVERQWARDAQAPTLPRRVTMHAFVLSDDTPLCVNYLAARRSALFLPFAFEVTLDEARVVAVGHE